MPAPQQASRNHHCPSSCTAFHMWLLFCCWHCRPPRAHGPRLNPGISTLLRPASLPWRESRGGNHTPITAWCLIFGNHPDFHGHEEPKSRRLHSRKGLSAPPRDCETVGPDLPMLWQSQNHMARTISSLLWDLAVIRGTMAWTDILVCPDFICNEGYR